MRRNQADLQRVRRKEKAQFIRNCRVSEGCIACGENHPATLVFHHRDESIKEFNLAKAAAQNISKKRLLAEIAKCDVYCANCHRKLHYRLKEELV